MKLIISTDRLLYIKIGSMQIKKWNYKRENFILRYQKVIIFFLNDYAYTF